MSEPLHGKVVRLVTDEELLINLGSEAGVRMGDQFKILDSRTMNVTEPGSNRDLGSIERVKSRVTVVEVAELMALARVTQRSRGLSGAAQILTGANLSGRLTSGSWPDGVEVNDPVSQVLRATGPTS